MSSILMARFKRRALQVKDLMLKLAFYCNWSDSLSFLFPPVKKEPKKQQQKVIIILDQTFWTCKVDDDLNVRQWVMFIVDFTFNDNYNFISVS